MSLTSNTVQGLAAVAISLAVVAGCSDSGESSFVYSDRTLSLIPEAQTGFKESKSAPAAAGVRSLVDDRFGNPQHLRAWQKLPVDFGGTSASVSASAEGTGAVKEVALSFAEGVEIPGSVETLQFVTGACAGEMADVLRWDVTSGKATLVSALKAAPAAGDTVAIGGGGILKTGRVLYQRHCSHCHGTAGDGNGPTAQYLIPRPRDYRHGTFKFKSTNDQSRASRGDLARIIKQGIPGTYMPSFLLLADMDVHALVEYVRFLAMRGEFERKIVNELASDYSSDAVSSRVKGGEKRQEIVAELRELLTTEMGDSISAIGDELAEAWTAAQLPEAAVVPSIPRIADTIESRRRGRELYLSGALKCADCHGISAQGNGPQTTAFEVNPATNQLYAEPGLHDDWDNLNQPRNLVYGIYRGGRRPIDLFSRIHAGIKGSRMPSFKNLPHEDIWHLVNYVLSIPFEVEPGSAAPAAAASAAAGVESAPVGQSAVPVSVSSR